MSRLSTIAFPFTMSNFTNSTSGAHAAIRGARGGGGNAHAAIRGSAYDVGREPIRA